MCCIAWIRSVDVKQKKCIGAEDYRSVHEKIYVYSDIWVAVRLIQAIHLFIAPIRGEPIQFNRKNNIKKIHTYKKKLI